MFSKIVEYIFSRTTIFCDTSPTTAICRYNGVFPKCIAELSEFSDKKIFVIIDKGLEPATNHLLCKDATTAPSRHMWETRSLNWFQFMLQWFIRFPGFTEFNESSAPFRKKLHNVAHYATNNFRQMTYNNGRTKAGHKCQCFSQFTLFVISNWIYYSSSQFHICLLNLIVYTLSDNFYCMQTVAKIDDVTIQSRYYYGSP